MESPFPDRPQRYVPRGVAPRQIDQVTMLAKHPYKEAEWWRDVLGTTFTGYTTLNDDDSQVIFALSSNNEKSHDLGFVFDPSNMPGRAHHLAWWVDSRDELLRAADILLNADVPIEFGPGRHGIGEQDYLYVREPGGFRIEVNTSGYRLYVPDWEPSHWTPALGSNAFYRNIHSPLAFREGFPDAPPADDSDIPFNPYALADA